MAIKVEKTRTGKLIRRNPGVKKIPVMVARSGAPHVKLIRRETNEQLMRESLDFRGLVRLRVQPAIQGVTGRSAYCGWHDASVTVEAPGVEKAQQFVAKLQAAIIQICKDLDLTAKSSAVLT